MIGKGRRKPPLFCWPRGGLASDAAGERCPCVVREPRSEERRKARLEECFSARTEASFEAATRRLKTRLGGSLTFANRRGASLDALRQWTEGDPLEARVFTHHLRRACRASRRGVGVAVELSGGGGDGGWLVYHKNRAERRRFLCNHWDQG